MVSEATELIFQGINMMMNDNVVVNRVEEWTANYEANLPTIKKSKSYLQLPYWPRQPVVVIGAGPGLDENVHLLENFDIPTICVGRALKKVLEYTKPSLVTSLEADPDEAQFFKGIDTSDLKLLISADASHKIIDEWEGELYFTVQYLPEEGANGICDRQRMETGIPPMTYGGNVGNYSYIMAKHLQANPIVLIGMDMCFKAVDNPSEEGIELDGDDGMTTEIDTIEGKRYANAVFLNYTYAFIKLSEAYANAGIVTINCTGGGILYEPHIRVMEFEAFRKSVEDYDAICEQNRQQAQTQVEEVAT